MEDAPEQIDRWLDALFGASHQVTQLDAIVRAETFDLPADAMDVIATLPPGRYTRARLCDQLNSAIVGRGLAASLGPHE